MDFNQHDQVTGYKVCRSSDPAPPPSTWPLVASDIVDGDEATPNKQWVDTSGDVSPTGIWYYEVTAYNHRCPVEGPFLTGGCGPAPEGAWPGGEVRRQGGAPGFCSVVRTVPGPVRMKKPGPDLPGRGH